MARVVPANDESVDPSQRLPKFGERIGKWAILGIVGDQTPFGAADQRGRTEAAAIALSLETALEAGASAR